MKFFVPKKNVYYLNVTVFLVKRFRNEQTSFKMFVLSNNYININNDSIFIFYSQRAHLNWINLFKINALKHGIFWMIEKERETIGSRFV